MLASIASWTMFTVGMVLMIAILLRRSSRYQRRVRREQPETILPPREPSRDQPLLDAPPEICRWQVEMHETARELKGELDSKARVVQQLIQMADQQARRLEVAIHQARRLGIGDREDILAEIESLADMGPSDGDRRLQHMPPPATSKTSIPHAASSSRIYALADQGYSPQAIAQRVAASVGDVEMILNLRACTSAGDSGCSPRP
jgi:hypothetical protein